MKKIFFVLSVSLFILSTVRAQTKYNLPKGAEIIETQMVTPERNLILWVQNPQKNPRDEGNDFYTCPEYTRGSFYSGKPYVSLVNSQSQQIINTLKLEDDQGELPIPYLIERHYYKVPTIDSQKEGKPKILFLQDYNGDGKAYEFAMFDALACQGLETALFGYSEKQDKIIQYPIELTANGKTETVYWIDYLFSKKPVSISVWEYSIDYRGRGGSWDRYEIRYNKSKEIFIGKLTSTDSAND